MICSCSTKRFIPHLTISTIMTLMSVKIKMTSSFMPPTLGTTLYYPNSWHNKTEGLNPNDTTSTDPTAIQASTDHPFNPRCAHYPRATECNQSQCSNPNHNFALSQFMAQPNCEDLDPTDTPGTVPTSLHASSDHTFNPECAHNLMGTQCNQSQYLT